MFGVLFSFGIILRNRLWHLWYISDPEYCFYWFSSIWEILDLMSIRESKRVLS